MPLLQQINSNVLKSGGGLVMIFSKHTYDIGKTPLLKHNIIVSDIPKKQKKQFLDQEKLKFLKDTCKILEEAGIISIVDQPVYTSNIVLVPKYKTFRDNSKASSIGENKEIKEVASYRLTQDLRGLNENKNNFNSKNNSGRPRSIHKQAQQQIGDVIRHDISVFPNRTIRGLKATDILLS